MTAQPLSAGLGQASEVTDRRTIPFDYSFRFQLTGRPGNVLNDTITVSIEATFVAVSIGYGVVPRVTPVTFGPGQPEDFPPGPTVVALAPARPRVAFGDIPLSAVLSSLARRLPRTSRFLKGETGPEAVLRSGIRLNPELAEAVLSTLDRESPALQPGVLENLFQAVGAPPDRIQFLYALIDEGSGREFQSEPILSTAGLGTSDGDRPFRRFPTAIVFEPRSTVRMQVTEISEFEGELYVSLHGYKSLGGSGSRTGRAARARRGRGSR